MLDRKGTFTRGKGSAVLAMTTFQLFFRLALDARWNGRRDQRAGRGSSVLIRR